MLNLSHEDLLDLGAISGVRAVGFAGHGTAVSTDERTLAPISPAVDLEWLSASAETSVASTSTDDAVGGPGAERVEIVYLDSSYNERSTQLDLDGTTPVPVADLYRVNALRVLKGTNVGQIYVGRGGATWAGGKPDAIIKTIAPGQNVCRCSNFTVPAGERMVVHDPSVGADSGKDVKIVVRSRRPGEPWYVLVPGIYVSTTGRISLPMLSFPEGTDLEIRANKLSGSDARVFFNSKLVLVSRSDGR